MTDEEYLAALKVLQADWGRMLVDAEKPGVLRAASDPFTGLLVGMRARIIAEIINRALDQVPA